jgi:hypothetical protein
MMTDAITGKTEALLLAGLRAIGGDSREEFLRRERAKEIRIATDANRWTLMGSN